MNNASITSKQKGETTPFSLSENFGLYVFNRKAMQQRLPSDIYKNVLDAMDGKGKIKPEYADAIALAMKEWAMSYGATHYTHWFQPMTGASAEKHDSFIDWISNDEIVERLTGKQLIQAEPDASSFPSGGLRSTYEARGYTGWNPTSPVFLWRGGDGMTLCIPSIFFSWTGDVLDAKIPLLRSDKLLNKAAMRLLHLTDLKAKHVYSTLGLEQEYFLVDRSLYNLRQDLILLGKTVFGAQPSKGQELQDHYFGSVKDRILDFMRDFEESALQLGIPVKTRHNEVAPAQYEVAPLFEKASIAIDHNLLLMELMRQKAIQHDLACLLHEKPFQNFNGSGKHCNWSLSTDLGVNLLDPTDTPENNFHFLILVVAILNAIHEHSPLLRAAVGSASNDYRLGGHEAPPAIISAYLGEELEQLLDNIEREGDPVKTVSKKKYDLGLLMAPEFTKETTDRNRTSPFTFTGNKFEFRAVGSSVNPAFPVTVLNAIIAESLHKILDEIEKGLPSNSIPSKDAFAEAALPVLRKFIKASKRVRFSGDNYSTKWADEAKERGLPNITNSIEAFNALKYETTVKIFEGILSENELISREEVLLESYSHAINIEANLMLDMWRTQILPAALKQQENLAKSISWTLEILKDSQLTQQKALLKQLCEGIEKALTLAKELDAACFQGKKMALEPQGTWFCQQVLPKCKELRQVVDCLETLVDHQLWPLPKYRELLFML